jgi:aspartate aminotransferase-like enzyme
MQALGWNEVRERHRRAAKAFTAALFHLGLEQFPENPSSAVQAFKLPDKCINNNILGILTSQHGIIAAGGQGELEGEIVRTGFLGIHSGHMLVRAVTAFASVLEGTGCPIDCEAAESELEKVRDLGEIFS